jgi:long-chain acyl-CoA synthetase
VAVAADHPFVADLVVIDDKALAAWRREHNKPADAAVADLREDRDLPAGRTGPNGMLTPSLKIT